MGKSSKDKRDIYYRLAKEEGWRARSAFKLLHIDNEYNIFETKNGEMVNRVVDLCAAPGSWSQVLSRKLWESKSEEEQKSVKIVAIDLQEMSPIPGVYQLQGDITDETTAHQVISHFSGEKAQLVICDGAPDVTGLHDIDEYFQHQLVVSALNIVTHILEDGGVFVAKIFRGPELDMLSTKLRVFFHSSVVCVKPESSREASAESFMVCRGYKAPKSYVPTMINAFLPEAYKDGILCDDTNSVNSAIVPFLCCGDLTGIDTDITYDLGKESHCEMPFQLKWGLTKDELNSVNQKLQNLNVKVND